MFPAWVKDTGHSDGNGDAHRANLSGKAQRYLDCVGKNVDDLFHHVLSVLHDPNYREANAGALQMEWPRIPLPGWPEGRVAGASEALATSTVCGRELARLLDPDRPVSGVTAGLLREDIASIAVPATGDGCNMLENDFAVTGRWGYLGQSDAVMPGQGHTNERPYTSDERAVLRECLSTVGESTFDIYLNADAFLAERFPPMSGTTDSADTRYSRNGFPIANVTFLIAI